MQATTVPVKANLDEIKRQLKHLGPSNRNTNPRDTRSTTVKIKPVAGYPLPHMSPSGLRPASIAGDHVDASLDARLEDLHDDATETTPLIRPTTAIITGKGGVHAVRKSYSGAGMSEAQTRLASVYDGPLDAVNTVKESLSGPQLQMPTIGDEAASQRPDSNNTSPTSPVLVVDQGRASSQGSFISMDEGSMTPRRRQIVRSGSISENVVETSSGVRKIIIQAASSDSEDGSNKSSGSGTIRARLSSISASPGQATPTQVVHEEGEDDESHEDPANGASGSANGTGGAGSKKKKKNKKKKGGKA
jgi:metal transporter CNNM